MPLPLWGSLEKSQDDNETIEQAIARVIDEHNADTEAHLAEGQSLQAHKSDEVIDHPENSIVADKYRAGSLLPEAIAQDRSLIFVPVGVLDGWDTFASSGGSFEGMHGFFALRTGTSSNNVAVAASDPGEFNRINWDQDWLWQATLNIRDDDNNLVTFGFCNSVAFSGNADGAFFRWDDGDMVVGVSESDGSETTSAITPPTSGFAVFHTYRIFYNSDDDILSFYIDGVLVHSFDPPAKKGQTTGIGTFEVRTQENAQKRLFVVDMLVSVGHPGF